MMRRAYQSGSHRSIRRAGTTLALTLLVAGCASSQAPTEQMAVSRAAISNAMGAGSNEFAPLQLRSAMDKMSAAERAMAGKDYDRARLLAEQAEVDAKLAGAMARSAKAQKAVDALQEDIRVLRQEIERYSK